MIVVWCFVNRAPEQQVHHAVRPESRQTLCLFHVPQANWQWLWDTKNMISKDDRPKLMTEFKSIMLATTQDEAEMNFAAEWRRHHSFKYPNWHCRVQSYWECWERWCVAWRSAVHRGHHTNNFSEITVRLFKDNVLARAKAYNVDALVDFVCTTIEVYYRRRLLDFAHNSVAKPVERRIFVSWLNPANIRHNIWGAERKWSCHVILHWCVTWHVCPRGKFCKRQAAVVQHRSGLCAVHTDMMQHFFAAY